MEHGVWGLAYRTRWYGEFSSQHDLAEFDSTIISHEIFPVLESSSSRLSRWRCFVFAHVFVSFIANSGPATSHNVFGWIITFKVWMRVCCSGNEISGQWDIVRSSKRINKIMTSFAYDRIFVHKNIIDSHVAIDVFLLSFLAPANRLKMKMIKSVFEHVSWK